ncbi:hypothetical protein [Flavobacterium sp. HSC-61S13]|uniref:hypothetical protein n=1 Tax=Flavobacterium sp. HSC-61S13 TaxID=2910963 RepID=UPI00209F7FC1|nr:hypothetical protein [Flavobacterium sp. HSC-61S13]MCP1997248.1 AAA15 family ATPase/GTPase [Flavobacterium sp. HSC-61S13]
MKNSFFAISLLGLIILTGCQNKKTQTDVLITSESTEDTSNSTIPKEVEEEFKIIDDDKIKDINALIIAKKFSAEEEIMQAYSPKDKQAESNYKYTITKLSSGNGKTLVQLVEENLSDDSVKDKKVIMRVLKNDKGQFVVDEIKESYRCRLNRGHQDWSASFCS